ncbi:MAG: UDP-N-acetylmuramoyl-L-alanyl-D-glutamate--2,6-diaminopimelate ligase [Acidimicrobiales bacterium]
MRLDALVREAGALIEPAPRIDGDGSVEVEGMTHASTQVTPGSLFACIPGRAHDGHAFAPAAVAAGAGALVVDRHLDLPVPQVVVDRVRPALGPLADALWDHPSRHIQVIGVTGTNGKTTTVSLLAAIFEAHGWRSATIGTLTQARTTPEAPELQARLAELRRQGVGAVVMEVSSHALDQDRVGAIRFAAAVLTNVTQDHLDYHGTMEAYFQAKARLFDPRRAAVSVVNADDQLGSRLLEAALATGAPTRAFGMADAAGLEVTASGSRFTWEGQPVELALLGRFNVANALAAAAAAGALGVPAAAVARGLSSVKRIDGRFEPVDAGQPFGVVVDYAHTPDGLAQALTAARQLARGRLIVVFGAGGDRDRAKRPLMGEVTARLADLVVVTSDNPRGENPQAIIDQVVAGAAGPGHVEEVADRSEAIRTALGVAGPGDLVLIAGKGHETGQDEGGRVIPFVDAEVARLHLERILGSRQRHDAGSGPAPARP